MNKRDNNYRWKIAVPNRRIGLATLLILVTLAAMGVFALARVSAQSLEGRDFFGTVVSVGDNLLLVATGETTLSVVVTPDTKVRLTLERQAKVADLVHGDRVAVSLASRNGRLVADQVFLVPDKPRFRHVPGTVVALTPNEITIQPSDTNAGSITFSAAGTTPVRLPNQLTTLAQLAGATNAADSLVGRFIVLSAVMRYDASPQVLEILVPKGRPPIQTPAPAENPLANEPAHRVEIRGVFTGLDAEGNWIIGGTRVKVDPRVAVDSGLAVGQTVEVKARVGLEGAFYAIIIQREDVNPRVAQRVQLEGDFQGVDAQGRWVISGTPVVIGRRSDTDEAPYLGQRARVLGMHQADGTLLAFTVENRPQSRGERPGVVVLQGVLESIDVQGKWVVSGIKLTVGAGTKLEGSPAVGHPVKATAVRQEDGRLLALHIEGRNEEITPRRGQAKIMGTVEQLLDDGSMVVNGVTVARTALTELEDNPQVGNFAVVEAILLENGALLAREVRLGLEVKVLGLSPVQEPEIRGIIERVNPDGSLVVNGVTVVVGSLTDLEIDLTQGVLVKVEGVLQADGSLLARKVRGESRGDRTSLGKVIIAGQITEIELDRDGNPEAVRVDGSRIALEALTHLADSLEQGADIEVRGIVRDGNLLASQIELGKGANQSAPKELRLEGRIESLWLNPRGQAVKLAINGLIVNILPATKVKGALRGGAIVEVNGVFLDGTVMAANIESREVRSAAARRSEFRLKAAVTGARMDSHGRLHRLVVDGRTIVVEGSTDIEPGVAEGRIVEVEGVINGETYVASKISLGDRPSGRPEGRR